MPVGLKVLARTTSSSYSWHYDKAEDNELEVFASNVYLYIH